MILNLNLGFVMAGDGNSTESVLILIAYMVDIDDLGEIKVETVLL